MLSSAAVPPDLLVISSVRALDPALGLDSVVDVVVEAGKIRRVGPAAAGDAARSERARVIDGRGLWLAPAFVDPHVHLRTPGRECGLCHTQATVMHHE